MILLLNMTQTYMRSGNLDTTHRVIWKSGVSASQLYPDIDNSLIINSNI